MTRRQKLQRKGQKGSVLILTCIIVTSLIVVAESFLYMTTIKTRVSGYNVTDLKALWLAEAGIQKAIWNLMTPIDQGGQGEDWTTTGTTETIGSGSYTMVVARWDYALAANGASAQASSQSNGNVAANAIDGNDATYWQSLGKPVPDAPQEIVIAFPYAIAINKVRFLVPSGSASQRPKDYTWQVSSDNVSYTVVVDKKNSNSDEVTDIFTAESDVNYLKLHVTKIQGGSIGVRVATLETIGSKISSTGTVGLINRKIEQSLSADDATKTAVTQKDWNEVSL